MLVLMQFVVVYYYISYFFIGYIYQGVGKGLYLGRLEINFFYSIVYISKIDLVIDLERFVYENSEGVEEVFYCILSCQGNG